MSIECEQIKVCYEQLGMTVEQIAEDRGLDVIATKAALMQSSAQYRKACGQEPPQEDRLNFNEEQLEQVNKVIYELALASEDDHLRFKAATYIRDDKKGRKDIVKAVQGGQYNILMFNEQMQGIREKAGKMKEMLLNNGKVINA